MSSLASRPNRSARRKDGNSTVARKVLRSGSSTAQGDIRLRGSFFHFWLLQRLIIQRRLLLTSQQRQIPLTALLSHATVSHDPNALAPPTDTPTFFCQERIREDGEIVLLSRPLPSCRTCSRPTSELEDSYRRFMHQVELPAVDYYSGGGGGMIGGRSFFDHKHAVEMDPIACQTLE